MAHHIGVVACSPPGASLCFEAICAEVSTLSLNHGLDVEVSVHAHAFDEYMRYIDAFNPRNLQFGLKLSF
jgi:aspartate racemase